MELIRCTAVRDSAGRFSPTYDPNIKETVAADQIILAIGQRPELAYAEAALKVNRGLLEIDPQTQATSMAGVYAGGDATLAGPLSVVEAIAGGRRAAEAINQYLGGQTSLKVEKKTEFLNGCNGDCLEQISRVQTPALELSQFSLDKEDILGLDRSGVETEANRCLNCGCDGVNPSDMAPALVALDARIVTSKRTIQAEEFWSADRGLKPTVLDDDEIVTEIQVPRPKDGVKSAFVKFALRKSIDFPIVNCAAAIDGSNARICLNAVHNNPYRVTAAEESIAGKAINVDNAEAAGAEAVKNAVNLSMNKYKIQIAKGMVKKAILGCA